MRGSSRIECKDAGFFIKDFQERADENRKVIEMKKVIRKVKHWLIKKLGGYIESPMRQLEHITVEPDTIRVSTGISRHDLYNMPKDVANKYAKARLAERIAEEIINANMCCIEFTTDEYRDYVIFKTNIKVLPTWGVSK